MTQTDLDDQRHGSRLDRFTAGRMAPWQRPWVLVLALVLGAILLVVGGLAMARSGAALPGVTIAGTDVGGLSEDALRTEVEGLVRARQQAQIEVRAADAAYTYVPGPEGWSADVDATVDAALAAGRSGPVGSLVAHVTATFGKDRPVAIVAQPGDDAVEAWVGDVAQELDQPVGAGAVQVDPETLEVTATSPQPGRVVDVEASAAQLLEVVGDPSPDPVTLVVEVTEAPTDDADVTAVAELARQAVAEPLVLSANGHDASITPTEIARMLGTEAADDELVLAVDADALRAALDDDLPAMETEPVDATFRPTSEIPTVDDQGNFTWEPAPATVEVVPGSTGQTFEPDRAAGQVAELLASGTRSAELALEEVDPDLTTDEARDLGITNLIGTFTTYHACCQNRVANIQRMADIVRGSVIEPGEEFSINDHVGQRTIAKGFVADGAIFQGELRDEVGGGVSQFATTMYNASFFAGIPILEHQPHSLYISRYPRGREATLNYDSIDLRIRNDTDNGIYLHTSYTGTSITVSLFGDNGGRRVSAVMGEPYDFGGFATRRRTNPALPEGQERVVQSGVGSYRVTVERIIEQGGDRRSEDIVTLYTGRPEIIEVGTGPPAPPPSESPSGDPQPSGDPKPSDEPSSPAPNPDPTPTASEGG